MVINSVEEYKKNCFNSEYTMLYVILKLLTLVSVFLIGILGKIFAQFFGAAN
jgi:hypothetical protein